MPIYALDGIEPDIHEEAWLAASADLMGKVRLGPKSSVWFGAVLRGDNELIDIGAGSNVQDGAILHTDIGAPLVVGENCTIGHKAILHGCTIGEQSLIGMGAVILNHVQIGKNCLIGAHALIPEGKVIPEGSLVVGVPGKQIRILTQEEQGKLLQSALNYQRNAARFKSGLRII